jgi:hypothetical protein
VTDKSLNLVPATLVQSACVITDGVSDKLLIASLTGSETVSSSGGTATPTVAAGEITFTAGTCWDLQLSNGSIYPLDDLSGAISKDTYLPNSAHGTWSTGGGGLATVRAGRTDDFHNFALNGGTVALRIADDGVIPVLANSPDTGLTLTMRVKQAQGDGCTFFNSDSKVLHTQDAGGGQTLLFYDAVSQGFIDADEWTTIVVAVDVGASIIFGSATPTRSDGFEIAWATLEGNGRWSGASFNDTTDKWYNTEFPELNPTTSTGGSRIQYPALSDLTDDVDGAGLQNPTVGVHNGGIFGTKQGLGSTVATSNENDIDSLQTTGPAGTIYEFGIIGDFDFTESFAFMWESDLIDMRWSANQLSFKVSGPSALSVVQAMPIELRTQYNHYKLIFDNSTGKLDMILNGSLHGTATLADHIGLNPLIATRTLKVSHTGFGGAIIGPYAVAYVNVDGIKFLEYKASNISGGTAVDSSGNGFDGDATGVTTSFDADSIYSGDSLLHDNDYWTDGYEWLAKSYIDRLIHPSYQDNVWHKFDANCLLTDEVTTDTLDSAQHADMSTWKGAGSCGNGVVPFNHFVDDDDNIFVDDDGNVFTF